MENSIYERYMEITNKHWWWLSRKNIIDKFLEKFSKDKKKLKILDYGSGTGINTEILKKYGEVFIYEPHLAARNFSISKYKYLTILDNNKNSKDKFDIILLADVLEHIKDHNEEIALIKDLLSQDGRLLITVPAHKYLFTKKDESLQHYRRYTKPELFNLLNQNQFEIEFLSYFNFFLSMIIIPITLFYKIIKLSHIEKVESVPNKFINKLFYFIFSFEKYFLSNKIKLPYGISLIAVAKK